MDFISLRSSANIEANKKYPNESTKAQRFPLNINRMQGKIARIIGIIKDTKNAISIRLSLLSHTSSRAYNKAFTRIRLFLDCYELH